jgi:7-cyano-7-deazaguanine synthase
MARAVVLLSGGLDSATTLAVARDSGCACYALSFDYGQRHRVELEAARRVAETLGATVHKVVKLDIGWMGGSALTDPQLAVPRAPSVGVPITYVPARNSIFLAVALGWAEVLNARDLFIGVNALDYSGYPDCRPAFIQAFQNLANLGTRAGVEGHGFRVHAPLINLRKAEIIALGHRLGVDYSLTQSCYNPDPQGRACGACDSCRLRAEGFAAAGLPDPTRYVQAAPIV